MTMDTMNVVELDWIDDAISDVQDDVSNDQRLNGPAEGWRQAMVELKRGALHDVIRMIPTLARYRPRTLLARSSLPLQSRERLESNIASASAAGIINPDWAVPFTVFMRRIFEAQPVTSQLGPISQPLTALMAAVVATVADNETGGMQFFREADFLGSVTRIREYIRKMGYHRMNWTGNTEAGVDPLEAAVLFRGWGVLGLTGYRRFVNHWWPAIRQVAVSESRALMNMISQDFEPTYHKLKKGIAFDASDAQALERMLKATSKSLVVNALTVLYAVHNPVALAVKKEAGWVQPLLNLIRQRLDLIQRGGATYVPWASMTGAEDALRNTIFSRVLPYPIKTSPKGTTTAPTMAKRTLALLPAVNAAVISEALLK